MAAKRDPERNAIHSCRSVGFHGTGPEGSSLSFPFSYAQFASVVDQCVDQKPSAQEIKRKEHPGKSNHKNNFRLKIKTVAQFDRYAEKA